MRSRVISSRLREKVVATLKTGESFTGVLFSHDDKALVLRDSAAMRAGENETDLPLDGEILILWADVAYLQKP